MDPPPRFLAPLAALLLLSAAPGMAQFANFPAADRVLGAPNFTTPGTGSDNATGLDYPAGVTIDPTSGKIFVASGGQNRVLRYANLAALANGANAEAALGQPDLTTTTIGTSQTKMKSPYGVFVDGQGRLWVADTFNHRVLMFEGAATLSSGAPADLVLGQSTFATDATAAGGSGMNTPVAVHVDADDDLWVADYFNRRVIGFLNVSSANNGDNAGCVIGQPDFMTTSPGSTDAKLTTPAGVVVDESGSLWVSDQSNARVLRFDNAGSLPFGSVAARVLGQTDFTSNTPGLGAQKFASPQGLAFDTAGNLLVTDLTNNRILVFRNGANAANGAAAIAVIGQADFASSTAAISSRQLNGPNFGIAADAAGGIWVSDSGNDRVLHFSADRTRPTVRVTTKIPKTTPLKRFIIRGRAIDTSGIESVRYRTNRQAFRPTKGTTSWRFTAKLKPGRNVIQILATDRVGLDSAPRRVRIRRE